MPQDFEGRRTGTLLTRRAALIGTGGAAVAGLGVLAARQAADARADGRIARMGVSARAFRNAIGVNTHWTYTDTPYGEASDELVELIAAAGIRQTRGTPVHLSKLLKRHIRTTALIDIGPTGDGTPAELLDALRSAMRRGAINAVEGPNEPDLFWTRDDRRYRGQGYPSGPVLWQRDLWRAVRSDPTLRNIAVIGPALGGTYWSGEQPFLRGSLRGYVDFGNFHPYPRDNPMTARATYAGIPAYYWNTNFPSSTLDVHPVELTSAQVPFGKKPLIATESGYSTWGRGSTEFAQGVYTPRILLENFRLGVRRTYLYELVDQFPDPSRQNKEASFGLLRNDLSPKPAYRAVRSLLAHTRPNGLGRGAPFRPRIEVDAPKGYDERYLHHLLIARGGDAYVLALWHEVAAEDLTPDPMRFGQNPLLRGLPAMTVRLRVPGEGTFVSAYRLDRHGRARQIEDRRARTLDLKVDGRIVFVHARARR